MTGNWTGSNRRRSLPANWPAIRAAILRRDHGRCTWTTDGQRCTAKATDVDHINRNAGDHPGNLRSLCHPHHARKSSSEGNAARWAQAAKRKRPVEPHPGLTQPKQ